MILRGRKTDATTFIMPLLFDKNDWFISVYDNSGFINAYLEDINRPQLCNHIFLVYESCALTGERINAILTENVYYYGKYYITIDDIHYTVYAFIRPMNYDKIIKAVIDGERYNLDDNTKVKITSYWTLKPNDYAFKKLFNPPVVLTSDKIKDEVITEEDPIIYDDETFAKCLGLDGFV